MGAGGETYGIALYPRKGTLAKIRARAELGGAALAKNVDSFAVTLDLEPQWVADAMNEGFDLPVVPAPMNVVRGMPTALTSEIFFLLTAVLEAASTLSPGAPTAHARIAHDDLAISVKVTAPV